MKRASRSVDIQSLARISRSNDAPSNPAGHVPGGGAWGTDGRLGAFRTQIQQIQAATPGVRRQIAEAKDSVYQ